MSYFLKKKIENLFTIVSWKAYPFSLWPKSREFGTYEQENKDRINKKTKISLVINQTRLLSSFIIVSYILMTCFFAEEVMTVQLKLSCGAVFLCCTRWS